MPLCRSPLKCPVPGNQRPPFGPPAARLTTSFHPRGFSPPRRLTPLQGPRVCCAPPTDSGVRRFSGHHFLLTRQVRLARKKTPSQATLFTPFRAFPSSAAAPVSPRKLCPPAVPPSAGFAKTAETTITHQHPASTRNAPSPSKTLKSSVAETLKQPRFLPGGQLQGLAPLTSPLRIKSIAGNSAPDTPMGFVPLQGLPERTAPRQASKPPRRSLALPGQRQTLAPKDAITQHKPSPRIPQALCRILLDSESLRRHGCC